MPSRSKCWIWWWSSQFCNLSTACDASFATWRPSPIALACFVFWAADSWGSPVPSWLAAMVRREVNAGFHSRLESCHQHHIIPCVSSTQMFLFELLRQWGCRGLTLWCWTWFHWQWWLMSSRPAIWAALLIFDICIPVLDVIVAVHSGASADWYRGCEAAHENETKTRCA